MSVPRALTRPSLNPEPCSLRPPSRNGVIRGGSALLRPPCQELGTVHGPSPHLASSYGTRKVEAALLGRASPSSVCERCGRPLTPAAVRRLWSVSGRRGRRRTGGCRQSRRPRAWRFPPKIYTHRLDAHLLICHHVPFPGLEWHALQPSTFSRVLGARAVVQHSCLLAGSKWRGHVVGVASGRYVEHTGGTGIN